jgi:hypothetical protein
MKKWVQLPVSDTEYFLLEYRVDDLDGRDSTGAFDTFLDQDDSTTVVLGPATGDPENPTISHNYDLLIDPGLLIWHIDERQALANLSQGRGLNVIFEKRSVTIEEADGLVDIGNPFSLHPQGTPFETFHADNNANFTPFTRPNSNTNLGPPSGISVTKISALGDPTLPVNTLRMDIGFSSRPRGWPMKVGDLGTTGYTSTTAADADADGAAEIAVIADSSVYLFEYDDRDDDGDVDPAGNWPAPAPPLRLFGSPTWTQALGDLDGNDSLEVIVVTDSGAVHCWRSTGEAYPGADSTGVLLSFGAAAAPTWSAIPADLDRDGADELYVPTLDGMLRGFDLRGPFPDTLFTIALLGTIQVDTLFSTVAFGDLNGDEFPDGIVAFVRSDSVDVRRFNREGRRTNRRKYPLPEGVSDDEKSRVWIGMADMDRDPGVVAPELFLATEGGWVQLLDSGGTPRPGWPRTVVPPISGPPAFGDLDGDGLLEIVIVSGGRRVHAFNYNGTEMPGWPVIPDLADFPGSDWPPPGPAIADVDGDGRQDVVTGFSDFTVRAIAPDGSEVDGFPLMTGAPVQSTPAILDANGDGRLDLFLQALDGYAYGHILAGVPSLTNPAWGMLLGGPRLHGSFDERRLPLLPGPGSTVLVGNAYAYPNPALEYHRNVKIQYTLGARRSEVTSIDLEVYDVSGMEILSRRGPTDPPTDHVIELPVSGFASGVYFCRLEARSGDRLEKRLLKFAVIR